MIHDMFFTLAGWLMFFLGVLLAGTVRSVYAQLRNRVNTHTAPAGG